MFIKSSSMMSVVLLLPLTLAHADDNLNRRAQRYAAGDCRFVNYSGFRALWTRYGHAIDADQPVEAISPDQLVSCQDFLARLIDHDGRLQIPAAMLSQTESSPLAAAQRRFEDQLRAVLTSIADHEPVTHEAIEHLQHSLDRWADLASERNLYVERFVDGMASLIKYRLSRGEARHGSLRLSGQVLGPPALFYGRTRAELAGYLVDNQLGARRGSPASAILQDITRQLITAHQDSRTETLQTRVEQLKLRRQAAEEQRAMRQSAWAEELDRRATSGRTMSAPSLNLGYQPSAQSRWYSQPRSWTWYWSQPRRWVVTYSRSVVVAK